VAEAAYVNGTLAHADELEAYGPLPDTGLVPPIVAALAAGEYVERTVGADYLTAMVADVEIQGSRRSSASARASPGFCWTASRPCRI
jgi:2-methylcitrate dehydratase PrpD